MKMKKEDIYRNALKLFRNGIESVGLREIATACGMKAPSLYNHFKSKEDLVQTLYRESYGIYTSELKNVINLNSTFKENLFNMVSCIYRLYFEDTDRFYFLLVNQFSFLKYIKMEDEENMVSFLSYFFKQGQLANEIRQDMSPEMLAVIVIGIVQQPIVGSFYGRVKDDLLLELPKISDICWNTIKEVNHL
jgi:AcrR family transcriptional regulator